MLARLLTASLVALLAACHSMRPVEPAQLSTKSYTRVWITTAGNKTVVLAEPALRGDTLSGFIDGAYTEMPVTDAHSMRAMQPAVGRTVLLAGAASAAAIAGFIYYENRSYVGSGEACSIEVQQQQQIDLHCGGPCPC